MNTLNIAATSLNQTPLDWSGNRERAALAIVEARRQGASLVCLPELCLSGYGCEDAFLAENTWTRSWASLRELLPHCQGMVVAIGLPVFHAGVIFNVVAIVVDCKVLALVPKQNLAGDGIHYEPRWFKPWPRGLRDTFFDPIDQSPLPIGDLMLEVGGVRIGCEICEDAWVARRPGIELAARAVDVILNPSASHFAFGKAAIRRQFVVEGSRAFASAYVYSNLSGNEAGRAIYDGHTLIAANGRLLAEGPRLGFQPIGVLTARVDLELSRLARARQTSHEPSLPVSAHPGVVKVDFQWPSATPPAGRTRRPDWEDSPWLKEEEFSRAVALGLFDYQRKSHTQGFTISLSGGADSAAVAALVHYMVILATSELGNQEASKLLGCEVESPQHSGVSKSCGKLLTTLYQGTENSGIESREAAATLARALGADHHAIDLSAIHSAYLDVVTPVIGRRPDWESDDLAMQNIQARLRVPSVWLLANLRNQLLLVTSNRSEAAVGYSTMDGDTAGSLAPIAGIDKAWLRQWLRWLETKGPSIGGTNHAIPALAVINARVPTAELRPPGAGQTDEDDLMPYEVLDAIERAAIRDKKSPARVVESLGVLFPQTLPDQRRAWVRRFFELWSRNQWKRERYAPGFHLDDENLDPKTWCRWPILSAGFEEELAELTNTPNS